MIVILPLTYVAHLLALLGGVHECAQMIQALMGLVGVGFALVMVSTFSRAQTAPIRLGYQKDLPTYLLMSGLWSSTLYFGGFLGPTIAGQNWTRSQIILDQ